MKIITLGSDPEFFVYDDNNNPFPATIFAKGTKFNPEPIDELGEGYYEQLDNISFEGNIPPTNTKETFIEYLTNLREYFENKVKKHNYSLSPNGVEYFKTRFLKTVEANDFGCSKIIDTWLSNTIEGFTVKDTPVLDKYKFRVAGFHIHIGYDEPICGDKLFTDILIGRLFDLFLTIPTQEIKPEPERIQTYGRWGVVRSKKYGIECRTLSSFFTQKDYLGYIYDQIMKIEEFINICNINDLRSLCVDSYIVGESPSDLKKIFKNMFSVFDNLTELKNKFKEIENL